MRLSRRAEYGLRALVDLVRHDGEGPIPLTALATRNRLPVKFLDPRGRHADALAGRRP